VTGRRAVSGSRQREGKTMRTSIRRGLLVTALAGTCVIAVMPAALAQATQSPEAIAADATGPITLGPVAPATVPPTPDTVDLAGVTLPGLLVIGTTSDDALVDTAADPSSTQNSATSSIDSLSSVLQLPLLGGLISAGAISSSCTYNSANTPSYVETTSIASLTVAGTTISLAGLSSPNDNVTSLLPTGSLTPLGITLSITLNQQVAGPNGSETVNAVAISLGDSALFNGTENIYLASSTCGPTSSSVASPVASGKGLGLGLGLLGLIGAGFGAAYVRRRSSLQAA